MRKLIPALAALLVAVGCATKEATSLKIYVNQKLFDKAISQGTQALKKEPNNGDIHYFMGVAYFGKDEELKQESETYADSSEAYLKRAFTHFLKAKELAPGAWGKSVDDNIVSLFGRHYNRGVIAAKKADNVTAATEYRLATVADPENYQGYYAHAGAIFPMAKAARDQGDEAEFTRITDAIIADLNRVLEKNPDRDILVAAHQSLGDVYYMRQETEKAQEQYAKAVGLDPENYDLMLTMGERFYNNQDWENAAKYFDDAMAVQERLNLIDETDYDAYSGLGQTYVKLGQWDDAVTTFDKVLKLRPNDPTTLYNIMVTHYKAGEAAEKDGSMDVARHHYRKGVDVGTEVTRLDSSRPEYWQVLGYCYRGLGNTVEAARALKKFNDLRQSR